MASNYYMNRLLQNPKISDLGDIRDSIYKILCIDTNIAEKSQIRVLDQIKDDNLILVSALSSDPEKLKGAEHVKGIVLDIEDKSNIKIIAYGFPHAEEYDVETITVPSGLTFSSSSIVTKAHEGTILRLFMGKKTRKWYVSTHRRINGRKSKWAGPTFGEMFDQVWGDKSEYSYSDYLDEEECHIFLVSHPENRLVCEISKPSLCLVGQYNPQDVHMRLAGNLKMKKIHPFVDIQANMNFSTIQDVTQYAKTCDWRECTGILVFNLSEKDQKHLSCYKLTPSEYSKRRTLRGDESNFSLRYLQLKDEDKIEFKSLFPEKKHIFDEIDQDLKELPGYLSNIYIRRFDHGKYDALSTEEYFIIQNTRRNYDPDISLKENIQDVLITSNPRQVHSMIKRMRENTTKNLCVEI